MSLFNWRTWAGAALCATAVTVPAHADVVTFEDVSANLFAEGDTFVSGGHSFTVGFAGLGFGAVDTAAAFLLATPPTGTSGQFFGALNDSGLQMAHSGDNRDPIAGFEYGFLSPVPGIGGPSPGALMMLWVDGDGNVGSSGFDFGDSDAQGNWAMRQASTPDFGSPLPATLQSVSFVACLYTTNGDCVFPADNLAQFALDNISFVPVPASWLLLVAGLAAAGTLRRRQAR